MDSPVRQDDLRASLIYQAKVAEQAERYEEMAAFMNQATSFAGLLSIEDCNLLSVAYKNCIGARRASWRIVSSIVQKLESKDDLKFMNVTAEYRWRIERELRNIITEVSLLLSRRLSRSQPGADTLYERLFLTKMQADYARFLAEFTEGDEKQVAACFAYSRYRKAIELASSYPPSFPLRLGLHLNYAVHLYEIMNLPARGLQVVQEAYEAATEALSEGSIFLYNLFTALAESEPETTNDTWAILRILGDTQFWQAGWDATANEKEPETEYELRLSKIP